MTAAGAPGPLLVAIDGPAGSGKSSVSREAAARLGFGILDTGAAYRALAWAARATNADLDSEAELARLIEAWGYRASLRGEPAVLVALPGTPGEDDVTDRIREEAISREVSRVARHAGVRDRLNRMFRELVSGSELPGVVIEGRDITTVVAPDAPVRILLTASAEVRARRRAGELPGADAGRVGAELAQRDARDAQVVDFLRPAPGVQLVDTSDMDFEGSVRAVIDAVEAARSAAGGADR